MKTIEIEEMLRDDLRRTLSCELIDTDEDNKMATDIFLDNEGQDGGKVVYLYQVPCSGEIGVGIVYGGRKGVQEVDFDDFTTNLQRQIVDEVFNTDGLYKPCTLMEKDTDNGQITPLLVIGLHQLQGGAWFLIDDLMRERLGGQLEEYRTLTENEKDPTMKADAQFEKMVKELSRGRKGYFCGHEYYFEYTDEQVEEDGKDGEDKFSQLLAETSESAKLITYITLESDEDCGLSSLELPTVEAIWKDEDDEIVVQIDGGSDPTYFDNLSEDWQVQIVDYLEDYEPMALVEKDPLNDAEKTILIVSKISLNGSSWPEIGTALRERHSMGDAEDKQLHDAINNLSYGKSANLFGREYFLKEITISDSEKLNASIDELVKLTSGQLIMVKQMEKLYHKMQMAGIAFALNENAEVVVYNCKDINDCTRGDWGKGCPDGYEYADMNKMYSLFQVWADENLYVSRK